MTECTVCFAVIKSFMCVCVVLYMMLTVVLWIGIKNHFYH